MSETGQFYLLISISSSSLSVLGRPPYEAECSDGKRYPCLVPRRREKHQCLVNGFPGGSDGKESACSAGDPGWISESGRFPGEDSLASPVFLPGEFHGQSLLGYSPRGRKELGTTERPTHTFIRLREFPSIARCLRMFVLNRF